MSLPRQQDSDHAMPALTLVGSGGNTGSHLLPLLARQDLANITLVDPGHYEAKDCSTQSILQRDIGQAKVNVQARLLANIAPATKVEAIADRVERIPRGWLRSSLLVSCLDSRRSRLYVNEVATRTNTPWVDLGVDATGWLARVNVYNPAQENAPCLLCAWDEADYAAVEQEYPCAANHGEALATNAPAFLGAVSAGLAAAEIAKIRAGDWQHVISGKQHLVDLRYHTHFVTTYNRNSACRFDHKIWDIERLPTPLGKLSIQGLVLHASVGFGEPVTTIQTEGDAFVSQMYCQAGHPGPVRLCLTNNIPPHLRRCKTCGSEMMARGFETSERLHIAAVSSVDSRRSLYSLGFRYGDIVSLAGRSRERHFQLGGRGSEKRTKPQPNSAAPKPAFQACLPRNSSSSIATGEKS